MSFSNTDSPFCHLTAAEPQPSAAAPALKVKEKPTKRSCSVPGCANGVVQGGRCVSHGAKRRMCRFPGCDKSSKSAGMCSKHGPKRKPCDEEGCTFISVRGTKCKVHAEPSNKCATPGCRKAAVADGVCKRHGKEDKAKSNQDLPVSTPALMPVQDPTAGQLSAAIRQNFLSSLAFGTHLDAGLAPAPYAYPYPALLLGQVPNSNYLTSMASASAGMGGLGLGLGYGSLGDTRARAMDSLTSDALMMLELARRSL